MASLAPLISPGSTVVFQGDSLTDCGRNRADPGSLGGGYALMIAGWFGALHPGHAAMFLNRGVSGDRAKDLQVRWDADCLALKPAWVSLMVGINDCWRRYDRGEATPVEAFAASCRDLLVRARGAGARLILLEPWVLPVPPDRMPWREDLDPKIAAVRALAREFDAVLVPLDGLFADAARSQRPAFWAPDGVHPTPAGHALIARAWLKAVQAIP